MFSDLLFVFLQHILPQGLISRLVGSLAASENRTIKLTFMRWFIKKYQVNMSEANIEDITQFKNFNDFFTRELKANTRTLELSAQHIISPADGAISQLGKIENTTLFQAKDRYFQLDELLGGNQQFAKLFVNGLFATVYLSPKDYHRVHMPVSGTLTDMIYIPGQLFSVNQATTQYMNNLFARNERAVCLFETEKGPVAVIMVGAMIVRAISTSWAGQVAPASGGIEHIHYDNGPSFKQGDEMGRFYLGSTAIVLLPESYDAKWLQEISADTPLQMGQLIGKIQ